MRRCLGIMILVIGFPIGIMCTASLPLILLGFVQPDPHPWNWLPMYITDFFFGLTLLTTLCGFSAKARWGRPLALVTAGYALFAFSQTALEAVLDITGLLDAPINQPIFILTFMVLGFVLATAILTFAIRYPAHWKTPNQTA